MHENRETSEMPEAKHCDRPVGEGKSRTAHMHVFEESDSGILPMSHSNKNGKPSAESEEGRPLIKENTHQSSTHSTQSEERVSQGLAGVRKAARERKEMKFTALLHHLTAALLRDSFYALKRKAAPGVDGVTWKEYETGLEDRLADLHSRVHRGAYRAQPSRRVYIPKSDGRQRPLGVAALEDKIVQQAVVTILNQIYEEDFRGFSYGFRPGRSQHQALDALYVAITRKKVNWVLDCDIRGFFDQLVPRLAVEVCPASRCRPPNSPADPEMVEGGSYGGRRMEGHGGGDSAGFGGFAAAGEHLSALRVRPVGGSLAQEVCARRGHCRPLRGRQCTGVPASGRCRSFSGGFPGTAAEVRAGTAPGQDAPD